MPAIHSPPANAGPIGSPRTGPDPAPSGELGQAKGSRCPRNVAPYGLGCDSVKSGDYKSRPALYSGMTTLAFSGLLALGSLTAGLLGALTGLGGGVVIVPLLTLGFGGDFRYAVGASLVSVIATSSGSAAAYVREGFTNIRVGMVLEVATTIGALFGAYLADRGSPPALAIVFGLVLLYSAYS